MGRWAAHQEKETKLLSRPDGSVLFPNLTRGNHYLVQAEGYLTNSASGQTSEMALIWNRTALPGGSVSTSRTFPGTFFDGYFLIWRDFFNYFNTFKLFVELSFKCMFFFFLQKREPCFITI